jgi:hypothetical protein
MTPEQEARAEIDRLLTAAGWHVCVQKVAAIPTASIAITAQPPAPLSVGASTARDRHPQATATARPNASLQTPAGAHNPAPCAAAMPC